MDWTKIILATLAAGIASVLTDWLFHGVLFHEKMKAYPEAWRRPEGGAGETKAIVISSLLGFFTCFVFVVFCSRTNFIWWSRTWRLALGVWLMAPVPMLLAEYQWMKMHPLTMVGGMLAWLAKLMLAAVAVAWLLL